MMKREGMGAKKKNAKQMPSIRVKLIILSYQVLLVARKKDIGAR